MEQVTGISLRSLSRRRSVIESTLRMYSKKIAFLRVLSASLAPSEYRTTGFSSTVNPSQRGLTTTLW